MKRNVKKLFRSAGIVPLAMLVGLGLSTGDATAQMGGGGGGMGGGGGSKTVVTGQSSYSVDVRNVSKTLGGQSVNFWGFNSEIPGPTVVTGEGDTFNLSLSMMGMMTPEEAYPYDGHTIHLHGLDVPQGEDGVPETGASVNGDTYTFTTGAGWAGTYAYHCHVHTVKHLEMGMYGMIVVKPVDAFGNTTSELYAGGPTYDHELYWTLSTVDPDYHTFSAEGDSPVFADYNPQYFLIYGEEGVSPSSPATDLAANGGDSVVFRISGMHSTNATFEVKDGAGNPKQFTVYMQGGRTLATPETVTSLDVSPGQTFDVMLTLPSGSGTLYPQVTYKRLRDGMPYTGGTAYGRITF